MGLALGFVAMRLAHGPERDARTVDVSRKAQSFRSWAAPAPAQASASPLPFAPKVTVEHAAEPFAEEAPDESTADDAPPVDSEQDRIDRLIAAGFTELRAREILQREAQLRRDALHAGYASVGGVGTLNGAGGFVSSEPLRRELGDADYERYLAATGQPTRVVVRNVAPASAAANAGLLPGDEILAYAGQRVFNLRELNTLMLQRSPGEIVSTAVIRDGVPLQLYVNGGLLGLMPASPP
jgi:hypothetical protein